VFQVSQEKWNLRTKPVRVRKELEELVEYLAQRYGLRNEYVRNVALAVGLIVLSEGLRRFGSRALAKDLEVYVKLAKVFAENRERVEEAVGRFTAAEEIFEALVAV